MTSPGKKDTSQGNLIRPKRLSYVIPGDPNNILKPAFLKAQKGIFDDIKNQKLVTAITLRTQHGELDYFQGPLHVEFQFFMPLSNHKARKDWTDNYHTAHKALDDLIDYVLCCCNHILWSTKDIVSSLTAHKRYSRQPRTEFTVCQLERKYVK